MRLILIRLAFRKLRQDKLFSVVNILGLSVSLAVCLLIVLFIKEEVSYDNFHTKADRIALFQQFEGSSGSGSGFQLLLKNNLSRIEEVTRLLPVKPVITNKKNNQSFHESGFCFADGNFLKVFDLKIVNGSVPSGLASASILISDKAAEKYFPGQDAVGQQLQYNNKQVLTVAGIFQDLPANSHIAIDFICSFTKAAELVNQRLDGYWDGLSLTYVLLASGTTLKGVAAQLPAIIKKTADPNATIWKPAFIPLRDIYLRANLDGRVKAVKAINEVYIFSAISLLVLLLACFNYVNLGTARAFYNAKEVGIRKITGAGKAQIVWQYLQESSIHILLAATGGLLLASVAVTPFNNFAGTALSISQFYTTGFLAGYVAAVFALAFITGIFPALTLASYQPLNILKQVFSKGHKTFTIRKVLVVLQFTVSIIIIIAVFTVSRQLFFIRTHDLGYDRKEIVTLNLPADAPDALKQSFKERLQILPVVASASICSQFPGGGAVNNKLVESFVPAGKDVSYSNISVDKNFLRLFDISILQGSGFSPASLPGSNEFIINASMADLLDLKNIAVGKPLGYYAYQYTPDGGYKEVPVVGKIIGVVGNYHQSDLRSRITPLLIQLNQGWEGQLAVKLKAGKAQAGITAIENVWKQTFRDKPYEYGFLDDAFQRTYKKETTTAKALSLFASLTIFISCLGLIGLTAITVERRIKEIGIRKTLGAGVAGIVRLLTQDFVKLILIAFVLATPVAWWAMHTWLQNFAYRIEMRWWMFITAAVLAIIVSLFTISFQAVKAALANPVKSLRTQ